MARPGLPRSLLTRVGILALCCLGIPSGAFLLVERWRMTTAHDETALRDLHRLAKSFSRQTDLMRPLAERIAVGLDEARESGLERAVLEAGRYLEIFDTAGRLLYRSPNLLGRPLEPPLVPPPDPEGWHVTGGRVEVPGRPPHHLRLITLRLPGDGPILRIAYYTERISEELTRRALGLALVGLVAAALLTAGVGWIVSRHGYVPARGPALGDRDFLHDLRSLLNVVRSETEVALQRPRSPAMYRAVLSSVLEATMSLSDTIERLRGAGAAFDLATASPVALADVVRRTVRRLHVLAALKAVRLRAEVTRDVVILGDRAGLRRLVFNLLENAIRFTPRSGQVTASVLAKDGQAQLIVEDTGPGIPEQDLPRVFERGFRGTTRGGWGLGLPIALAIARAHGGTIEAANRTEGGIRITVTLPRHTEGASGPTGTLVLALMLTLGALGAAGSALPLGLRSEALRHPAGGRPSAAVVDLGRRLFSDRRLSADGSVSCESCHQPDHAFADPRRFSVGAGGRSPRRHTPTLVNRAFGGRFFWDGREESLERLALQVLELPAAMGNRVPAIVEWLSGDRGYRRGFEEAFGAPPSADALATALAAYLRTIYSGASAFDRYEAGQTSALSPAARRGLALFRGRAGCARCHSGFNFTDETFHNTGVGVYEATPDLGRYLVTKREEDKGAFKTPTLRDVARRPPYMHDGSLPTLEAVVAYYDRGGTKNPYLDHHVRRLGLSQHDQVDLVAFLRSLTGSRPRAE